MNWVHLNLEWTSFYSIYKGQDWIIHKFNLGEGEYVLHVEVLGKIGWVSQGIQYRDFEADSKELTMYQVILSIVAALYTGGASLIVEATIKAVGLMADDSGELTAFQAESQKENRADFQMGYVNETNHVLSMSMAALELEAASSSGTALFFFKWSAENAKVSYGSSSLMLNDSTYNRVRETIIARLGRSAVDDVINIEI